MNAKRMYAACDTICILILNSVESDSLIKRTLLVSYLANEFFLFATVVRFVSSALSIQNDSFSWYLLQTQQVKTVQFISRYLLLQ